MRQDTNTSCRTCKFVFRINKQTYNLPHELFAGIEAYQGSLQSFSSIAQYACRGYVYSHQNCIPILPSLVHRDESHCWRFLESKEECDSRGWLTQLFYPPLIMNACLDDAP